LAVLHVFALLVLLPLPVPWWVKPPLMAAVVIQWVIVWRHHLDLKAPAAVKSLQWNADGRWELFCADGTAHAARLLPAAYVHPWLVVLRFVTEDKRRCSVVLPADGLPEDEHRRLRVRLGLIRTLTA
jgi:hypothetical protein